MRRMMTTETDNHEGYGVSAPRWTPGSLAQRLGHICQLSEADAVERLTRAAADMIASYESGCDCGDCTECRLRAAAEAAERWGR